MPKVSEAHRAEIRRHLLDATERCLTRSGYEGFTTREVAREAGLSNGILYNYFSGKGELLVAVARRQHTGTVEQMRAYLRPGGDLGRGILLRLMGALLGSDGRPGEVEMYLRERSLHEEEIAEVLARHNRFVVDGLAPLVERDQAEGFVRPNLDAGALVEALALFIEGLEGRVASGTLGVPARDVIETFFAVLCFGVVTDDRETRDLAAALIEEVGEDAT